MFGFDTMTTNIISAFLIEIANGASHSHTHTWQIMIVTSISIVEKIGQYVILTDGIAHLSYDQHGIILL